LHDKNINRGMKTSQCHLEIYSLRKKRYKSCHWGCTFSKGKLLSILGANMYILGANVHFMS